MVEGWGVGEWFEDPRYIRCLRCTRCEFLGECLGKVVVECYGFGMYEVVQA